jgi:hypothetical protein
MKGEKAQMVYEITLTFMRVQDLPSGVGPCRIAPVRH